MHPVIEFQLSTPCKNNWQVNYISISYLWLCKLCKDLIWAKKRNYMASQLFRQKIRSSILATIKVLIYQKYYTYT